MSDFFSPANVNHRRITGSLSTSVVLPENSSRRMASFYMHSEAEFFLKLGTGATTIDFAVKLGSGSYYELPLPIYTGSISGVFTKTTGSLHIAEWTAV